MALGLHDPIIGKLSLCDGIGNFLASEIKLGISDFVCVGCDRSQGNGNLTAPHLREGNGVGSPALFSHAIFGLSDGSYTPSEIPVPGWRIHR